MLTALIVVAFLILILVLIHNFIEKKKNRLDNIFKSVNTQLKKRYNLIFNLIIELKEFMSEEKETLEKIVFLRNHAIRHNLPKNEIIDFDIKISEILDFLLIATENYPELKKNENIIQFKTSLKDIEEKIENSINTYNNAVTKYNHIIKMLPINFFTKMLSYEKKELFIIKRN